MRHALPLLLVLSPVTACEEGVRGGDSPTGTPLSAVVSGAFQRLDDGTAGWLGVEEVEVTTADGSCALTREIEAVEADLGCQGCALTLAGVTTHIADEVPDCGVDLEQSVPTVGSSIAFRTSIALRLPTGGEVLIPRGDEWTLYSSGLLEAGAFSYHHHSQIGGGVRTHDDDIQPQVP